MLLRPGWARAAAAAARVVTAVMVTAAGACSAVTPISNALSPGGRDPVRLIPGPGRRAAERMHMARDTLAEVGDQALLVLYANGDAMAARLLMDRLLPGALRYAARALGDRAEAEDVAQEALFRMWRVAADWLPGEAQPKIWLYRVVANLCTDRLRARPRPAL